MMVSMSVKHLSVSLNTHARPSVLSAFVGYGTKKWTLCNTNTFGGAERFDDQNIFMHMSALRNGVQQYE